jgi:hypothetical protein
MILLCVPGKTSLVVSMLKNVENCFVKKFDKIIWCHGVTAAIPSTEDGRKIFDQAVSGFPVKAIEDGTLFDSVDNNCLILDDLMMECGTNPTLTNLFTKVRNVFTNFSSLLLYFFVAFFSVFSSF